MYRILIADDEAVVREGMRDRIDWESHGFSLVGVCADGRTALDTVEREQPDVVLTDICMPFIDGLDLSQAVYDRFPGTRVILLTGYDRIDYAQEAVRRRVSDFLLKPITPKELRSVLDRVRSQLDADREERERYQLLQRQLTESIPFLRERTLNSLVQSVSDVQRTRHMLELCDVRLEAPWMVVALLDCDRSESEPPSEAKHVEIALLLVEQVAQQINDEMYSHFEAASIPFAHRFRTTGGSVALVITGQDEQGCVARALEFCEQLVARVGRESDYTVSAGIGRPVSLLENLNSSFREAREALASRYRSGHGVVTEFRELSAASAQSSTPEGRSAASDRAHLEAVVSSVKSGGIEESREAVGELVAVLKRERWSKLDCRTELLKVLIEVLESAGELGLERHDVLGDSDPFRVILEAGTLDEAQEVLGGICDRIHTGIDERREQRSRRIVLEAQRFIEARSTDPDLQLADVCREVGASSSYFSVVFKQATGQTFVEFLTSKRIEHAKRLLRIGTGPIYEIAEVVGYRDPHYFSMIFKKAAGVTASEFRKASNPSRPDPSVNPVSSGVGK